MNRVWGLNASGAQPTKPASLEVGYPKSSGNATVPGYWWYYMITETLLAPIVSAGLTPNESDLTQLTQAISILAKQNSATAAFQPVRVVDTVGVTMNGLQTVDGQALAAGDRYMRAVGSDPSNGIWVVNSAGAWTRPSDWASGTVLPEGVLVEVADGTVNANSVWTLDVASSKNATVDTTAVALVDITASTKAMFASYLTIASAASTYLTQASAASTYAKLTDIANFITTTTAASTYLKQTDAANTYATISSLNTVNAKFSSYSTTTTISSTYETITDATNKYNYLTGTPRITGLAVNCTFGGNAGWIYAAGDIVSGYSDDRFKDRVDVISNALDKLKSLTGFIYRPNELAIERGATDIQEVGLSAQEVQAVVPEMVTLSPLNKKDEEGNPIEDYLTIRYERVVPLLVEAIKELSAQMDNMKQSLDQQSQRFTGM